MPHQALFTSGNRGRHSIDRKDVAESAVRHLNSAPRGLRSPIVNPFPEDSKLAAHAQEVHGLRATLDAVIHDPALDAPPDRPHPFVYFITIHNDTDVAVTVVGRKWVVRDEEGKCVVVEGDGVVGQRPRIEPGGRFNYSSYHTVATDSEVEGAYLAFDDSHRPLVVRVPKFSLNIPA